MVPDVGPPVETLGTEFADKHVAPVGLFFVLSQLILWKPEVAVGTADFPDVLGPLDITCLHPFSTQY